MSITILKLDTTKGQKIARPYNNAYCEDEMVELLEHHMREECKRSVGLSMGTLESIARKNFGTENPILHTHDGAVKFYAFHDEV